MEERKSTHGVGSTVRAMAVVIVIQCLMLGLAIARDGSLRDDRSPASHDVRGRTAVGEWGGPVSDPKKPAAALGDTYSWSYSDESWPDERFFDIGVGMVAEAGDVNGDGIGDVIISTMDRETDGSGGGGPFFHHVHVFHGRRSGLPDSPDWSYRGTEQRFLPKYWYATSAGDVNGDGYDDVLVTDMRHQPEGSPGEQGRAYLFYGSSTGLSTSPDWTVVGPERILIRTWYPTRFGAGVAGAGDINDDGYDDFAIGLPWYRVLIDDPVPFTEAPGALYIYHGSPDGPPAEPSQILIGPDPRWQIEFGRYISLAGDVDGDGFDDLAVGDPYYDIPGSQGEPQQREVGRALVYHGSSTGLSETPDWSVTGDRQAAYFGMSVSNSGDVNGDGHDDLVVGVADNVATQGESARLFVYHGSSSGLSDSAATELESDRFPFSNLGHGQGATFAGDVDNDGYDDVMFGAELGLDAHGAVTVFAGSAEGLTSSPAWTLEGDPSLLNSRVGSSVSTAGDVDGDGDDEIIVSAAEYVPGDPDKYPEAAVFGGRGAVASLTMSLTAGWNVAGMAFDRTMSASDLCQEVLEQGGTPAQVSAWTGGAWQTHQCGLPVGDFSLDPGDGVFIQTEGSSTWEQSGTPMQQPAFVDLSGWSLLTLPSWASPREASQVCDQIDADGGAAEVISRWGGASWQTHRCGTPVNDFTLNPGAGFFVEVSAPSTWSID